MIDSQPDLAPLIRRVRGGYLKIQGTWMPYEVALRLSRRVAWPIKEDLIPLFGPTFPSTCLSPEQPGFGQVVASGTGRRRTRRANPALASTMGGPPRDTQQWTVVTPATGAPHSPDHAQTPRHQPPPFYPAPPLRYPGENHTQQVYHQHSQTNVVQTPTASSPALSQSSSISRDRSSSTRYSPYPGPSGHQQRKSDQSTRGSLSLDIPSLTLHERPPSRLTPTERIVLPPIQPPTHLRTTAHTGYALPPISALEDLRGIYSHDSAAVLRRLQADDSESEQPTEQQLRTRRRSLSAPPYQTPSPDGSPEWPSGQSRLAQLSRSLQNQHEFEFSRASGARDGGRHPYVAQSFSDASPDGSSTCDPSPVSPATPRSVSSSAHSGPAPPSAPKGHTPAAVAYTFPSARQPAPRWASERGSVDTRMSASRRSSENESDSECSHSFRPW